MELVIDYYKKARIEKESKQALIISFLNLLPHIRWQEDTDEAVVFVSAISENAFENTLILEMLRNFCFLHQLNCTRV